jgi:hypothetical protein
VEANQPSLKCVIFESTHYRIHVEQLLRLHSLFSAIESLNLPEDSHASTINVAKFGISTKDWR